MPRPQVRPDPDRRLLLALRRLRQLGRARGAARARMAGRPERQGGRVQSEDRGGQEEARRLPGGASRRDPEGLRGTVLALPEGRVRPEAGRPQRQARGAGDGRQARFAPAPGRDDALAAAPRGDGRQERPGLDRLACVRRPAARGIRGQGRGGPPQADGRRPQEGPEGDGGASAGRPRGAGDDPGQHGRGRRPVRRAVRPARGQEEGARRRSLPSPNGSRSGWPCTGPMAR